MANYSWFFLALVGPVLYGVINHIDKNLLEKYFKEDGVGTLLIYSVLLSSVLVPVALFMDPTVLQVSHSNMAVLAGVAALDVVLLWAYLKAMESDEPTVVIIYYQLIPVLGLVFGYLLLGEVITHTQLVAMVITLVGTGVVAFELNEDKIIFKKKTAGFMLIACTCWALEGTIFKKVALEENLWRSIFWEHLVLGIFGLGLFCFVPKYRKGFLKQFSTGKQDGRPAIIVGVNIVSEMLYMTGSVAMASASLMVPVALLLLVNSYQAVFVMVIGVLLAVFFPKLATEKVSGRHLMQKVIAIAITGVGTYLLLQSGVEV